LTNAKLELEQGGLLHDSEELLLIYLTISISVCFINHFLRKSNNVQETVVIGTEKGCKILHRLACSSSSVIFSPSSFATRFRFLKLILPVSSSSNNLKALRISSCREQRSLLRTAELCPHSATAAAKSPE